MLASIQKIDKILPHNNADLLEIACVLGWRTVVKKGEFKEGDLVVYIQIDSVLPEAEWCEFMRERNWLVRSVKFRKELSQGMIFPLSILPIQLGMAWNYVQTDEGLVQLPATLNHFSGEAVGKSVTEILGVTKYEKQVPRNADALGQFPLHIINITDEERIQNIPRILDYLKGKKVDISIKHDGTSFTYIREGNYNQEFMEMVCSRRQVLKERGPEESYYWKMVHKYNLRDIPKDIVIQGELCGPSIQGNKEALKEYKLRVFNVFSQKEGWYTSQRLRDFCKTYNLETATHIFSGEFSYNLQDLLDFASEQRYNNGSPAEGIVVRSSDGEIYNGKPLSFKVISNKFLLKYGE